MSKSVGANLNPSAGDRQSVAGSRLKMMILFLCVTLASLASGQLLFPIGSPPTWSPTYTVEGVVVIPYAEIEEPFVGYADMNNRRSRVDYYGGMDKTFQRADVGKYGTMFKVVPETTENVKNEASIFMLNHRIDILGFTTTLRFSDRMLHRRGQRGGPGGDADRPPRPHRL